jgi:uncharacterized protein (DUF302 family)
MSHSNDPFPLGTHPIGGVVHRRSPYSVAESVQRLTAAIAGAGAKLFTVIDQSGEADNAGLSLRDTKLVVFGSPAAGTPVMETAPVAALDLPLKILVWADDNKEVWMTFLSGEWLAGRYGIPPDLAKPLGAAEKLTKQAAGLN